MNKKNIFNKKKTYSFHYHLKGTSFTPEQVRQALDLSVKNYADKNDSLYKQTEEIGVQLSEQLERRGY